MALRPFGLMAKNLPRRRRQAKRRRLKLPRSWLQASFPSRQPEATACLPRRRAVVLVLLAHFLTPGRMLQQQRGAMPMLARLQEVVHC